MKSWSIRSRLTLWYTIVLSLGLVLLSCTVWTALHQILYNELSQTLTNQTQGLEEYIRIEDEENPSTLAHEIDEFARSLPARHVLVVAKNNGAVIYQSGERTGDVALPSAGLRSVRLNGHPYLVMVRNVELKGRHLRVVLALSSLEIEHTVKLLGVLLAVFVPAFILCGALGGRWLSRRALQPVAEITEKAHAINVGNLSERLPVPQTGDEIQRLAETWNAMLARLDFAVSRISQFTADASHELRTPIAVIRLAAENALRKLRSESDYRAALHRIKTQSEQMTGLVEDLLFLARADVAGYAANQSVPVDISEIARAVASDLGPFASQKSISLRTEVPESAPFVYGDESALRRLILILLDNAIKYTLEGGSVSLDVAESDGQLAMTVSDTGIGMSEETQAHVFERFFRADPSRNKDSGGYGLGLALAQAIARQHGARLEVSSQEGVGSTFSIYFPVYNARNRSGAASSSRIRTPVG